MTLEDKISLCTGGDFWHTKAMPQYGIPAIMVSDGPHGLRCQAAEADMIGINESLPATCFPTAVTAGATWNRDLYAQEGEAIGREGAAAGVSVVLGPGCNIKRNPLGGRNFEYISEDPYFAGHMAASFIRGQQSVGVASSVKHFAVNNQEYKRQNGDSQLDERTFREIYLTPFEIAVKEGQPGTVMCSYNKINGIHASDNKGLLTDILRTEWDFDGLVVTDWGALNDRIEGYKAGCDLNMPGGSKFMEKATLDAVRSGKLDEAYIDATVERILRLVAKSQAIAKPEIDWDAHHALALKVAEQGAVLLKNEDNILPLAESDMVLIGYMAANLRYQGSGSSHINPTKLININDAMANVPCCACGDKLGNVTEQDLCDAMEAAKKKKIAVVVVGLPDSYESEAFDRDHMRLPEGHNKLVEAVAKANPNTVVVLLGGSAMELPWADQVKAILYMGLPGQAGGQAVANLLTGKVNPSGKLTETWPVSYDDVISKDTFGKKNTEYREGIYVGYRYYDRAGKPVRYPFGHGLSYTTFAYSNLTVCDRKVSVLVKNTGAVSGAEVVQLYIAPSKSGIFRPVRELKGFERVELEPGESKTVEFMLDDRSFAIWSEGWKIPSGAYAVQIAASSRDIRLEESIEIFGEEISTPVWQAGSWYESVSGKPSREEWEKLMGHPVPIIPEPKKGQFTMDSTCMEMKDHSFVMKIQYMVTENIIAKGFGGKKDMTDPAYRMMITCATDCPMRSVIISGGGAMSNSLAQGLLHMANGHYIKGFAAMLKK
ncbi:MAG: glycoside hydrolase family 3 C-terminal domain-containing protein [Oscillospiraceae bacterium]|nr:glycoside hydrolase family 3 C-terminal domain-containing protein [Oscillospiraceae bacterium]